MNTAGDRDIPGKDSDFQAGGSDDGDFDLSGFADGDSAPKRAGKPSEGRPPAGERKAPKAHSGDKGPMKGPRSAGPGPRAGGTGPRAGAAGGGASGGYDRPKRAYGDRPERGPREGGPSRGSYGDRPERGPRTGGYADRGPRAGGERSSGGYADRAPRAGGPRGGDRAPGGYGDKGPRAGGYADRAPRSGGFADRGPRGEGGPRRPPASFRNDSADRPQRSFGPRADRPEGERPRRFAPRPGAAVPAAEGTAFKPVSLEVKPWLVLKQDKGRWKESRFILEGAKNIADVLAISPAIIHEVFVDEAFAEKDKELLAAFKKNRIKPIPVTADDIRALADTETPQGVIAVCNFATLRPDWNLVRYITVLDAVQDPGNVGAIFRTSAALGMDAVVLGKGSCDPYNPKVVRSSVGALMGMPFETGEDLGSKINFLRQKGFSVVATSSHAKQTLEQAKLRKKVALIVGNEGAGTGASYQDMADAVVKIPLKSKVESLNVAVAHGILSYQLIHGRE